MAAKNPNADAEMEELRSRLEWMDEERRKTAHRVIEFEQRLTQQERLIESRQLRIDELEEKLSRTTIQLARLSQLDSLLQHFKDELIQLVEQYDQRRIQGMEEFEKLRRVENEVHRREISDLRKDISGIGRIENEMEMRVAEEARLSKLLGGIQGRISSVENNTETWDRELKFLDEAGRNTTRSIAELETKIIENYKLIEPFDGRFDITNHSLVKLQTNVQELETANAELRQSMKSWSEQIQIGEYERNQRIDAWQHVLDEFREEMKRFNSERVKFANQNKEAKSALETMAEWQKQIELQEHETAELARVEANRMKALWDDFLLEDEKRWKNFEIDRGQRWSGAQRRNKEIAGQFNNIVEEMAQIQQEKDALWRIQNAQSDAIKKWPRLWLEEVEKAISHDPNSRRQPALVPVREE